ncbi:hypothetical protein ACRAWD_03415 [Caulobacter segnis]
MNRVLSQQHRPCRPAGDRRPWRRGLRRRDPTRPWCCPPGFEAVQREYPHPDPQGRRRRLPKARGPVGPGLDRDENLLPWLDRDGLERPRMSPPSSGAARSRSPCSAATGRGGEAARPMIHVDLATIRA